MSSNGTVSTLCRVTPPVQFLSGSFLLSCFSDTGFAMVTRDLCRFCHKYCFGCRRYLLELVVLFWQTCCVPVVCCSVSSYRQSPSHLPQVGVALSVPQWVCSDWSDIAQLWCLRPLAECFVLILHSTVDDIDSFKFLFILIDWFTSVSAQWRLYGRSVTD